MEYFLLGLLALAIPVAWSAAFFMSLTARHRMAALETRFLALERSLAAGAFVPASAAQEARPAAEDIVRTSAPLEAPVEAQPAAVSEPMAAEPATPEPAGTADAAIPPSEPPPPDVTAPPVPPAAEPGLEERLGTRWVVWVGGIALALGAIFLVRYSIEQGLIGPGLRVFLGALFAAALIAAGEWARRKENLSGLPGLPQASIPAILTAAGTTAAFATVWAAHGLYGFIGPAIAFLLLGIVALATLAAALLHGPAVAGLGLVGAYVTPVLVSTEEPSYWALYLYLAVVTAAAFALARMRLWRWLAITAVAFSAGWILPGLAHAAMESTVPHAFYVVVGFALAAAMIVSGLAFGPDAAG